MKKLWLLLKIDILRMFNFNKLKNENKKSKGILKIAGIIILSLLILSSVCGYVVLGITSLKSVGLESYLIPLVYTLLTVTMIFSSMYRAKSFLFTSDEMAFALPIKSSTILTSKIISLTIFNFFITTIIMIPTIIIYGIMMSMGSIYYIMALIIYLFLPFLPTIIGCIFGYLMGFLSSKFNIKKGFETVVTMAFMLGIMYVSMNVQTLAMKFVNNIDAINKFMQSIGFIINSVMLSVVNYDIKQLIIYICTNVISLILFIAIFSKSYMNINQGLKSEKTVKKYVYSKKEKRSALKALIIKEAKMYFSIPVYVMNTSFGLLMLIIGAFATIFYDTNSILKMMELEGANFPIHLFIYAFLAFIIATVNTACSSISIEGKNFWILKSSPIKEKDIFISKIALNLLLIIPTSIVSIAIFYFTLNLTILQALGLILFAVICSICFVMFGFIVNLLFPRFDYSNYTFVVKQSIASMIGMMVPIMLVMILSMGSIVICEYIPINTYILVISALLFASIVVEYIVLKKWGIKRFREI